MTEHKRRRSFIVSAFLISLFLSEAVSDPQQVSELERVSKDITWLNEITRAFALEQKISNGEVDPEEIVREWFRFGNVTLEMLEEVGIRNLEKDLVEITMVVEKICGKECVNRTKTEKGIATIKEYRERLAGIEGLQKILDIAPLLNDYKPDVINAVNKLMEEIDDIESNTKYDLKYILFSIDNFFAVFGSFRKLYYLLPSFLRAISMVDEIIGFYKTTTFLELSNAFSELEASRESVNETLDRLITSIKIPKSMQVIKYIDSLLNADEPVAVDYQFVELNLDQTRMNLALSFGKDKDLEKIKERIKPVLEMENMLKPWAKIRENARFKESVRRVAKTDEYLTDVLIRLEKWRSFNLHSFKNCSTEVENVFYHIDPLKKMKIIFDEFTIKEIIDVFKSNRVSDPDFKHLKALSDIIPLGYSLEDEEKIMKVLKELKENPTIKQIRNDLESVRNILVMLTTNRDLRYIIRGPAKQVAERINTWMESLNNSFVGSECFSRYQMFANAVNRLEYIKIIEKNDSVVQKTIKAAATLVEVIDLWNYRTLPNATVMAQYSTAVPKLPPEFIGYAVPVISMAKTNLRQFVYFSRIRQEVGTILRSAIPCDVRECMDQINGGRIVTNKTVEELARSSGFTSLSSYGEIFSDFTSQYCRIEKRKLMNIKTDNPSLKRALQIIPDMQFHSLDYEEYVNALNSVQTFFCRIYNCVNANNYFHRNASTPQLAKR